jgi:hypothetical protein
MSTVYVWYPFQVHFSLFLHGSRGTNPKLKYREWLSLPDVADMGKCDNQGAKLDHLEPLQKNRGTTPRHQLA